jgi:hypothetical protein
MISKWSLANLLSMTNSTLLSRTTLRQPWLNLARVIWVLLAAANILVFIIATVNTARLPLPSCINPELPCSATVQVTLEDVAIAAAAGLPVSLLWLSLAFSVTARLSLALVGLLIFFRKSDDWMAMFISAALMTVLLEGAQGVPAAAAPLVNLLFGIGTALFLPLPIIFPNGRFEPPWMKWPIIAVTVPYVALVTLFIDSPHYGLFTAVVTFLWIGLSLYAMPYRYFRVSSPIERQQIKWVLLGIATTFVTAIYYATFTALYPASQPSLTRLVLQLINMPLYVAGYGFFAFAMLRAMLRHRLWDVDIIIRRTLVYTVLSALLALVYFGAVILLQSVFDSVSGRQPPLVIVASTLLIAALFAPLRQRVQAVIDRRFFRKKYDAQQILAQFAQTARDEVEMEALTAELCRVVQETMQPNRISLWLKPDLES